MTDNRISPTLDGDTRSAVLVLLLKLGPVTASDLGERLGLSAAGVRRHLDKLVDDGLAETAKRRTPGRGRPAKHFRLTDAGRAQFGHGYDSLASAALAALRQAGGDDAVRQFARQRVGSVIGDVPPAGESEESVETTAHLLAAAFDRNGYVAEVNHAGGGIQLCQHHCPVAAVAAEHPELCVVEHEEIAAKLGTHVQPLASLTDGNGICTTNIPLHTTVDFHSNGTEDAESSLTPRSSASPLNYNERRTS